MEQIKQLLINNAGNRLTPELINGLYHGIDQAVRAMLEQAKKEALAEKSAKPRTDKGEGA